MRKLTFCPNCKICQFGKNVVLLLSAKTIDWGNLDKNDFSTFSFIHF